jgi:hypothetical protein
MISLEENLISKLNSKKEIREKETCVEINNLASKLQLFLEQQQVQQFALHSSRIDRESFLEVDKEND